MQSRLFFNYHILLVNLKFFLDLLNEEIFLTLFSNFFTGSSIVFFLSSKERCKWSSDFLLYRSAILPEDYIANVTPVIVIHPKTY